MEPIRDRRLTVSSRRHGGHGPRGAPRPRPATSLAAAAPDVQATLDLLGLAATERGDLDRAEAFYRQAAELCARYFPGQREEVLVLNHLGVLYRRRGEIDAAQGAYERALAIAEKVMPDGPEVAGTLNNLGLVAEQRQDWARGEAFHRRALAIREKLSPGSLDVASSLGNLGVDALRRGDLATAEGFLAQALDLKQKKAAGSESHGNSVFWLGELRRAQKNWAEARRLFEEAAAMRRRVAPASGDLAEAYQRLGAIAVAEGHPEEAARQLLAAADVLDIQRGRLGATADGTGFAARVAPVYREAVDVLVALDRKAEAFAMLERSRARGLLAQIAERELTLPGLPAALEERRQTADAEFDRLLDQMGRLAYGKDDARIAELTRELSA
ncbi:MAG: tetratricopeptide repeat protein, partial [Solirubrobacteraceae bacterium]